MSQLNWTNEKQDAFVSIRKYMTCSYQLWNCSEKRTSLTFTMKMMFFFSKLWRKSLSKSAMTAHPPIKGHYAVNGNNLPWILSKLWSTRKPMSFSIQMVMTGKRRFFLMIQSVRWSIWLERRLSILSLLDMPGFLATVGLMNTTNSASSNRLKDSALLGTTISRPWEHCFHSLKEILAV